MINPGSLGGNDMKPRKSKITTEDFTRWLVKASAGDRITYHTGPYIPSPKSEIAEMIYRAHENKQVYLFQRRTEPGVYDYLEIRSYPWRKRV